MLTGGEKRYRVCTDKLPEDIQEGSRGHPFRECVKKPDGTGKRFLTKSEICLVVDNEDKKN